MRVSSALNYAFAWGVRQWPSSYDPGRAFQRVQPGQRGLPTRTRRALRRPEYRLGPPRSGIQPTGYHHSRPTSQPGRGGVVLRLSYPAGCGREASVGVQDPVPQPGNAVTTRYGRAGVNDPGHNSRPATERWSVPHRAGFIPPRGGLSPRYRCNPPRLSHTGGCKFVKIFAIPGWRITSVCYSHQYQSGSELLCSAPANSPPYANRRS